MLTNGHYQLTAELKQIFHYREKYKTNHYYKLPHPCTGVITVHSVFVRTQEMDY